MKKILILTDFSKNATAAAEAGYRIAARMHKDVLLYNSYIKYPSLTGYAAGAWLVDEFIDRERQSKKNLQFVMEGLESLGVDLSANDRAPRIDTLCEDCDLGQAMDSISDTKNIELIVMGAKNEKQQGDTFLYGADTTAVIENARQPILIVPEGWSIENLREVIYATDFEEGDIKAIHHLTRFGSSFHLMINIIHVNEKNAREVCRYEEKETSFRQSVAGLKYPGLIYHDLNGKDTLDRLQRLLKEKQGSMLAMLHMQNSYLIRLFQHSLVTQVIKHQKSALLIYPSKME